MTSADLLERVVLGLEQRGWHLAIAESLTGGLLGAAITDRAGVSSVFRGGITAYATDVKASLLHVNAQRLTALGPVDPEVALAMAAGARTQLSADVGLATTGVAGPQPQAGHPVGQVYLAVVTPTLRQVRELHLCGDRSSIRRQSVDAALELAALALEAQITGDTL